jgi:catechol 2,3-dioxygenase-like lactoylglutathione lyase family enzyme
MAISYQARTGSGGALIASGNSASWRFRPASVWRDNVGMPIAIESCNHVTVQTKRLADSIRFYQTVLGAQLISRPNFSFAGAWLFVGGIQIHLIEKPTAPDRHDIDTQARHVAFAVTNVDEAEEALKALGVTYKRKLIADRGIHQIFFQDPDGNMIEAGKYGQIDA